MLSYDFDKYSYEYFVESFKDIDPSFRLRGGSPSNIWGLLDLIRVIPNPQNKLLFCLDQI